MDDIPMVHPEETVPQEMHGALAISTQVVEFPVSTEDFDLPRVYIISATAHVNA